MSQSGATVSADCITAFNELKLGKKSVYIIYKLSDNYREIVVEETSTENDWEAFREKLVNAKSKTKSGAESAGPRYAVYDYEFEGPDGGKRNKICFIAWSPDNAAVMPKMTYASSKDALKRALTGIAVEIQANDPDDIEEESMMKAVSRGAR